MVILSQYLNFGIKWKTVHRICHPSWFSIEGKLLFYFTCMYICMNWSGMDMNINTKLIYIYMYINIYGNVVVVVVSANELSYLNSEAIEITTWNDLYLLKGIFVCLCASNMSQWCLQLKSLSHWNYYRCVYPKILIYIDYNGLVVFFKPNCY